MEIVVTDLAKSREFYVDLLGLHVTEEDENTIYLRSLEEFIHHNLVLRKGPIAAVAAFAYRVKSPAEVDAAEAYYKELGCRTERRKDGFTKGIGDSVRVEDPLGFPYEFFYEVEHVERLTQRYDLYSAGELVRLDHFNQVTPDVPRGRKYLEDLGFRVSEDIQDSDGVTYAAWMHRKQTVHDTALTGGNGPRMHHVAFATHEKHNIIQICDKMGALRISDRIERGPGRHGVSNAFYLYILDPDGHRVEIYTQDYYTGDPDNPIITWDVHDNQRRDWWGNPVVPSWYTEASLVLDLDGNPQPVVDPRPTAARWPSRSAPTASPTPARTRRRRRTRLQARGAALAMLDAKTIEAIADELLEAGRSRTPVPRLTARYPEMTVEDSYAVQQLWRRRNEEAGRKLVGRKIGLTSKAMQAATGITEPDYGAIFDDMVLETGCCRAVGPVHPSAGRGGAGVRAEEGPVRPRLHHLRRPERHRLRGSGPRDPGLPDRDGGPDHRGHHRGQRRDGRHGDRRQPRPARRRRPALGLRASSTRTRPWRKPAWRPASWTTPPPASTGWPTRSPPTATAMKAGDIILAGSFTRPMWVYKGDTVHADYGPLGSITCRFE